MSIAGAKMTYRRLRAPRHSGQVLVDPHANHVGDCIASNRQRWQSSEHPILGMPLHRLARLAREHLLDAAFKYTSSYHRPTLSRDSLDADTQLVLSGHQPRLFHPGVWFKNFVLHSISAARQCVGVHLIVDNDLCVNTSIRVPSGNVDEPRQTTVAFDRTSSGVALPFEAQKILDKAFFASFPQRVHESFGELPGRAGSQPHNQLILDRLWEHAIAATDRSDNLGICFSQARHLVESELGLETLEVPLSHLCDHPSFLQFAAYLLQSPSTLREQYGKAILQYRATHGLRSQTHPAPLLEHYQVDEEDWYEAPFWIWSDKNATRDRLFVRAITNGLQLARGKPDSGNASNSQRWTLPIAADGPSTSTECTTGTRWQTALQEHRLRLRPRALITTMFARVFLSDLFLHGIGGAKYDQVTDQLITLCFGMTPPTFMTVTATMHLPVARHAVDPDELRQLNGMLRELWFHPEAMLPDPGADQAEFQAELKKKKKKLLANIPPRGQRKAWNDDLLRNNTQLRELAQPLRSILIQQRSDLIQRLRGDAILASREYAFCLFSRHVLGQNLLDMAVSVS